MLFAVKPRLEILYLEKKEGKKILEIKSNFIIFVLTYL
jgi:hypothetical protein